MLCGLHSQAFFAPPWHLTGSVVVLLSSPTLHTPRRRQAGPSVSQQQRWRALVRTTTTATGLPCTGRARTPPPRRQACVGRPAARGLVPSPSIHPHRRDSDEAPQRCHPTHATAVGGTSARVALAPPAGQGGSGGAPAAMQPPDGSAAIAAPGTSSASVMAAGGAGRPPTTATHPQRPRPPVQLWLCPLALCIFGAANAIAALVVIRTRWVHSGGAQHTQRGSWGGWGG